MRSMKRGVVDLGYITGFQRASIIGVISIVQAWTLARLIAEMQNGKRLFNRFPLIITAWN